MRLPDTDALPFPVFTAGPDGAIDGVNGAFESVLPGRIGQSWRSAFPHLDGDDFDRRWQGLATSPATVTAFTGAVRVRHGEAFYDLLARPLIDSETDPVRLLGILIDVTERVRQQAETLAILDTAVDAIVLIGETGAIDTVNAAAGKLFGYTRDELIGQPVTMLMPEPHRSRHDSYMRRYLDTGEKHIIGIGRELDAVTRTGERVPIYLAVNEIRLQGRRRFAGIIRDLSEQRAVRETLAEQRERLAHVGRLSTMGEMTASIAHEINQPLTAIAMYAQSSLKLLRRSPPDVDKLATALDKLNTQSLRAGAIIERIQRFARARESQRELVAINGLLRDLVKLAEGDARLHEVSISFDLQDGLPPIHCDPIQIQQVALNLIRNAIDAMKGIDCRYGNAILITSRLRSNGRLEVAVADQGPGVASGQTASLFKPFHTTKKDGMGMGLSICKTIMAEHGGELSFHNSPDHGATFFFTLPTAEIDSG
jgi:two-component system, LuxR family, sensor kinase FixL